jgi:spore maturation protein CgeB
MKTQRCPICNQNAPFYCTKDRASYYKCDFCKAIFQHPLPVLQEMMDYANKEYSSGLYKEYLDANELKNATFRYRFEKVLEVFKVTNHSGISPRILDIGCSNGRFIDVAIQNSIDAWGLELSENAIAAATPEVRKKIYHGDANKIANLGIEKFNIITAFDLIEHLFDPIEFLNNLQKLITKDGIVILTTPDTGNMLRPLMGKSWPMLQPFQHTVLLSRKSARILLQKTNYQDIHISSTKKTFTPEYLFGQLRGPSPSIYKAYEKIKGAIPQFIRNSKFQVNIGEMMITASPLLKTAHGE